MSTASHRNRFHSTDNITKGGDQYYLIVGIQPDGNIYLHLLQSTYRTRGEHQHCHSKNKTLTLSSFLFVVYTLSNTPVVAALEWLVVSCIVVKYGQYLGRLHWRKPMSRLPWRASLFAELHQEMLATTAVSLGPIKFYCPLLHCITFDSILLNSAAIVPWSHSETTTIPSATERGTILRG